MNLAYEKSKTYALMAREIHGFSLVNARLLKTLAQLFMQEIELGLHRN